MKKLAITTFSIFVLLLGSYNCCANFFPSKSQNVIQKFVSKHQASKIELQQNLTVLLEESNLEIEEDFSCNDGSKNPLPKNQLSVHYNFSQVNSDFAALFDLNIFNNYFKNLIIIIIGNNPLYLIQSVFLI